MQVRWGWNAIQHQAWHGYFCCADWSFFAYHKIEQSLVAPVESAKVCFPLSVWNYVILRDLGFRFFQIINGIIAVLTNFVMKNVVVVSNCPPYSQRFLLVPRTAGPLCCPHGLLSKPLMVQPWCP